MEYFSEKESRFVWRVFDSDGIFKFWIKISSEYDLPSFQKLSLFQSNITNLKAWKETVLNNIENKRISYFLTTIFPENAKYINLWLQIYTNYKLILIRASREHSYTLKIISVNWISIRKISARIKTTIGTCLWRIQY